jgi:hypothetical protein
MLLQGGNATITLSGPASVWFGIAFGATEMIQQPGETPNPRRLGASMACWLAIFSLTGIRQGLSLSMAKGRSANII